MVYWILNLIFVITLHSCVASKYYYKENNGNYDVYYGPYVQWGYKEFRPPKSYKIGYDDRGDRPGKCIRGEFNCDSPYPIAKTRFFECEVDYQCPRFFKCCQNRCFQHRICQPIDLKATDDNNEIPTDEPVIQTTQNSVTTQNIHSTRRSTSNPTEGDTNKISEQPTQHTLRPTTAVKDEDIKQSTSSIATTSSPTTIEIIIKPTKETVTLISTVAGEDHSSPSTVRHTTTSKATQPSTSHSTKFTTIKRSEATTTIHLPSDVSTGSPSTLKKKITTNIPKEISTHYTSKPTTTVKNEVIPSTPKVPIEFSTTDKDHLTTSIYTTTSKVTQPSTAHSTTEITTAKYLPSDISTTSPVTHAEGNRTPKETSTEHTLNTPIKLEKESSQSTSAISTEPSTVADRITDVKEITASTAMVTADYLFSTIFPYSTTSTTTEPTTSISTKSSTTKGTTITTVSHLSSSPSTLQQEKNTAPNFSTQHMLKPTTTEKTEDTQSTSTVSTQFSTSTREITSTTTVTPTQSTSSYAVTSKATQPTLAYNTTTKRSETTAVTNLASDVFSTSVITHEPEVISITTNTQPTRQNTEKASTTSSTKSGLTFSTTEYTTTTKSTSVIPELSTAKGSTTVMSKTSESSALTTQFSKTTESTSEIPELNTAKSKTTVITASESPAFSTQFSKTIESTSEIPELNTAKSKTTVITTSESPALTTHLSASSAADNVYPTTSVSSKTQLSTSTTKYETTEPTTESVTIKTSRILTPETTAVFETSLNSITSSSPKDMTKPKTKLTSQTTESSTTSPISITYKSDLQLESTTTAKTPSSHSEYITTKSTTNSMSNSQSTSTKYSDSTQVTELITTNSPFDYTSISSSTVRKSTTRMIDITSDDEDLIFSGDFEPSTINNELPSKSSVIDDAKTTTKILGSFKDTSKQTATPKGTLTDSSITKPESYELTSSTVQPFDTVTSSASEVISNTLSTTLTTSKQTTGTKSAKTTTADPDVTYKSTSINVTDVKSGPITDDEDLIFSGDGDLQSDNLMQKRSTTRISSVITETNVTDDDFTFSKEVPRSSLKSISGKEELENKEFHDVTTKVSTHYTSDSTRSISKSNTDKISTVESSDKLTTIASSDHTMPTTDIETNQIINENEGVSFTKEPHSKENIFKSLKETEGTKNTSMAYTIQHSTPYSSAVSLINSTHVYTNTEEANTQKDVSSKETFSHDGYFSTTLSFTSTFPKNTVEETQKLTSKITDADSSDLTTSLNTFSPTTSPESGNSYGNKIYMMEKLLDTSRKLPSVHEKAGNDGDNYNFNNFLGLLDKISDLLGKKSDTIHNNFDFQISSPSTEKSTSYNTDQETMQSTTEGKHIMQVVEVEN